VPIVSIGLPRKERLMRAVASPFNASEGIWEIMVEQ
jgi:hypothetical protein